MMGIEPVPQAPALAMGTESGPTTCGPLALLPTCIHCAASVNGSKAWVEGGTVIVQAGADGCVRKAVGGDAFVVKFSTEHSFWRVIARDHGNGTYTATASTALQGARLMAQVHLVWTSTDPDFLEERWAVEALKHQPFASCPVVCNRSQVVGTALFLPISQCPSRPVDAKPEMQCVRKGALSERLHVVPIGGKHATLQGHCSAAGRWVRQSHCAALGLRCPGGGGGVAPRFATTSSHVWLPFRCVAKDTPATACAPDVARCLAGRRVLIVADSIGSGFAYDVCERLGRDARCSVWNMARQREPDRSSTVVLSTTFGSPPRRGIANLVPLLPRFEAALADANDTIVVLQSGAHDISLSIDASVVRVAPLATYRHHIRFLARAVARVQRANPTVRFVWRATTHQQSPMEDPWTCQFPGTHPGVVARLNAIARAAFRPLGVDLWDEPEQMTLSAPTGSFRDPQHHDICGAGTETLKTRSHHCAASRLAGRHEELGWPGVACGYRTHCGWAPLLNATTGQLDTLRARGLNEHQLWAALGGLSEAITDTFFTSVLGCTACARREMRRDGAGS